MLNWLFVGTLAVSLAALLYWGARTLPRERWQILAAVPIAKNANGHWQGLNLTYYGLFSATGTTFGLAMVLLLLGSVRVPLWVVIALALFLVGVCVPASRLIAALVEHKRNTFTVAGAAFIATLLLPWMVLAFSHFTAHTSAPLSPEPVFAAVVVGYVLGESIGRLACLSFGCCYGVPLRQTTAWLARLFREHNVVIDGATKKAAYASGLEGEPLVPVQIITSVIFAAAGLSGMAFFLCRHFKLAAIVPLLISCAWRTGSEWLRADYRGSSRISAYQRMAILSAVYLTAIIGVLPSSASARPRLADGLAQFASVPIVIGLQCAWIALFLYYGRSRVTASTLSFHVVQDRI